MRLYSLKLENIGPFDEAEVEFLAEGDTSPGVTLLTGMNGTAGAPYQGVLLAYQVNR